MDILDGEEQILRILQPDDVVVDVAVDSSQRFEGCELFGGFNVPDVAGMPNLIHVLEEIKDLRDDGPMSVGNNSNSFHQKLLTSNFLLLSSVFLQIKQNTYA